MEVDELVESLQALLNSDCIIHEGELACVRVQFERINGLQIHVRIDEHSPPHFHVVAPGDDLNASFRIDDGRWLKGKISNRNRDMVEWWYKKPGKRQGLIRLWNKTRPSDCPVGPIPEE
jgi:hypothetical protein